MQQRTIDQLEHDLRGDSARAGSGGPDLAQIHGLGTRRRRARGLLAGSSAATAVVAVGLLAGNLTGGGDRATEEPGVAVEPTATPAPTPTELSPLARRVLNEIPGAVQVSDWQVVIPTPGQAPAGMSQAVPADLIDSGPQDIGTRRYTGVTAYNKRQFPAWLFDGVETIEQTELGSLEEGYPVGSTDMGIIVDAGPFELACIRPLPDWGGDPADGCLPAMLGKIGTDWTYEWGMGTDDFMQPGKPLELFAIDDFTDGTARTTWVGGTDGTDVASVEFVGVDGRRVEGTVATGTIVPGETMFWGTVTGDLALAVTRDADGTVLERHELKPCHTPVECEVR